MTEKRDAGFTLIELMIVIAVIGILSAVAVPKFGELIRKSTEGASKGNLGALRSSLTIYYGDMEGQYPTSPAGLTIGGKYLSAVPPARTPYYHPDASTSVLESGVGSPTDAGGWAYRDVQGGANFGMIIVNCSHTDSRGSAWTSY